MRAAAFLLTLLLAAPALADEGALFAHSVAPLDDDALSKKGSLLLRSVGAGRFEPADVRPSSTLLADGTWLGPAPLEACPTDPIAAASLPKATGAAAEDLAFGRMDRAAAALADIAGKLACLDAPVETAQLYRLWFLTGALHHLQGREDAARLALTRAALVDRDQTFDESFSPAVRDLLVRAKEEVLSRPVGALLVVANGTEVRVDGRLVQVVDGRGEVPLIAGDHLVQRTTNNATESRIVRLSGFPLRPGSAVLVVAEATAVQTALSNLASPDSPEGTAARRLVQAWLLAHAEPSALFAFVGKVQDTSRVWQVDAMSGAALPYQSRGGRGDVFTRRARLAAYLGYRAQARGSEEAQGYGDLSLAVWASVSWLLRVGIAGGLSIAPTERDDGTVGTLVLPEISGRARLESPTFLVRPYGEVAGTISWPYAPGDVGGVPVGGYDDPQFGLEAWGGVVFVPGQDKRVGINVGVGGGAATNIGGYLRIRAGAELRF